MNLKELEEQKDSLEKYKTVQIGFLRKVGGALNNAAYYRLREEICNEFDTKLDAVELKIKECKGE